LPDFSGSGMGSRLKSVIVCSLCVALVCGQIAQTVMVAEGAYAVDACVMLSDATHRVCCDSLI